MSKITVRIQSIRYEAEDIRSYQLVRPDGENLPEFAAGSHIDVQLGNGLIRQYSLCGADWNQSCYQIGVLREKIGTGGSEYFFKFHQVGDLLQISEPKHLFKLVPTASRHLLLAGGIGITPILSMVRSLERSNSNYELHYCCKSPENMAFRSEIENTALHGKVNLHFDGGNPQNGLNLAETLKEHSPGTHLYYCGPPGMMKAAEEASSHWPTGTVHYEYFSLDTDQKSETPVDNQQFNIRLASSGEVYNVPADMSIVEVLRSHGHWVDTACEEGICGTCLTRYLEGDPIHMDHVLDDEDREDYLMICCARSNSPEILLDL